MKRIKFQTLAAVSLFTAMILAAISPLVAPPLSGFTLLALIACGVAAWATYRAAVTP